MASESRRAHWDDVYGRKGPEDVSWFQPSLFVSLKLIDDIGLEPSARIIDVGGGTSTLVDDLQARGFRDLTVLDISHQALAATSERLGSAAESVHWIASDVTEAKLPEAHYDLWHDRAVFHFLTDLEAREKYVELARRSLKPGGHIIVATFGLDGPEQCSGLDVVRYDPEALHSEFGTPFLKVHQLEESHQTPWGAQQEFIYCYCRRSP